jgi:hypothetical protein
MKENQEKVVYDILAILSPARTEQIKISALRRGVSCADRYLRWLSERGLIQNIGKAAEGDRTDTWEVVAPYSPAKKTPLVQTEMFDDGLRIEK